MPINRRRFLALSAVASLAPSAVVVAHTRREYMVQVNGRAVNAETPLELLTDFLTPNHLFFVRSHWLFHPTDQPKWTLSVDGDVATAMQLTLTDLRRMPVTEVTCMLERAEVKSTVKQVHTLGSDDPPKGVPPFHRSMPLRPVVRGPWPMGY